MIKKEAIPFLTEGDVRIVHREGLQMFGGKDGLRSEHLLKSALAMPEQSFGGENLHTFPFGMAAAYVFHMAENQPFLDGNKRTALGCALLFLSRCQFQINDPKNKLYKMMVSIGKKGFTKEKIAKHLAEMATPIVL